MGLSIEQSIADEIGCEAEIELPDEESFKNGKEAFVKLHDFLVGYVPEKANQFCMAGFILKNTLSENGAVTRGICETNEEGYLTAVHETSNIVKTPKGAAVDNDGQLTSINAESYASMNMWGLTPECLIISKCCRGRSGCSLVKIHIFSSALNTKENMKILEDYLLEKIPYMLVGFDPAVNRAVKYAIADKLLIQLKNGTFRLSDSGKKFVSQIEKDSRLLINEKQYLDKYSRRLTNDKIDILMSTWRYKNA